MSPDEFNSQFDSPPTSQPDEYHDAGHEYESTDTAAGERSRSSDSSSAASSSASSKSSSSSALSSASSGFFSSQTLIAVALTGSVVLGGTVLPEILPISTSIVEEVELNILSVGETTVEYEIFAAEEELTVRCYNDFVSYEQPLEIGWNRGFFDDLNPNTVFTVSVDGEQRFGETSIKKEKIRTLAPTENRFPDVTLDYTLTEFGILFSVQYDPELRPDSFFLLRAIDRESGEEAAMGEVFEPGQQSELFLLDSLGKDGQRAKIFTLSLTIQSDETEETVIEKLIRFELPVQENSDDQFADVDFSYSVTSSGVLYSVQYDPDLHLDSLFFIRAIDGENGEEITMGEVYQPNEQGELDFSGYCTEARTYSICLLLANSSQNGEATVTERWIDFTP